MKKVKLFASNAHFFEKDSKIDKEVDLLKKSIQVYKTNKHFKIITMYRTESWVYLLGQPVFLLPLDITAEQLSKVISVGLNHSRSITEKEENIIRNSNKHSLLIHMEEKSYIRLYKNSTSCNIYVENNEISIEPNIFDLKRGLVPDIGSIVKLEFSESKMLDIAKMVMKMLEKKVPPIPLQ